MFREPILLLSPHPDDVELGCGGTLHRLMREYKDLEIIWITFSRAEKSIPKEYDIEKEHKNALKTFNIKHHEWFEYPVREFHKFRQDILEDLIRIRKTYSPQTVFVHTQEDVHQDHRVVTKEAIRAFKSTATIIGYELPWNLLSFSPMLAVRLKKEDVECKWSALSNYKSQIGIRKYFTKEFIFSHARSRGILCNAEFAEAFEVIRWIL